MCVLGCCVPFLLLDVEDKITQQFQEKSQVQSVAGQPEIILCIGFLETSLSENEGTGGVGGRVWWEGGCDWRCSALGDSPRGAAQQPESPKDGWNLQRSGPTGAVGLTRTVIVLDISLCGA
jgi:hypothetical protein